MINITIPFVMFNLALYACFYSIGVTVGIEKAKQGKHNKTMRTYKKY